MSCPKSRYIDEDSRKNILGECGKQKCFGEKRKYTHHAYVQKDNCDYFYNKLTKLTHKISSEKEAKKLWDEVEDVLG